LEDRVQARRLAFLSGDLKEAFSLLRSRAERVAGIWRSFAASDPYPSAVCVIRGSSRESTLGVQVAQTVGHGSEHREQVRVILTLLDLEVPDLSGMAWGHEVGLSRTKG
jgi:hypothetical protein